jgi:hypothetical protein
MGRTVRVLCIPLLVVAGLGGCGDDGGAASPPETAARSVPAPTAPATAVPASSTTSIPPTAPIEVWDLVYVSDSSGWGVADEYAARIAQDVGVRVEVHDLWGGGLPARTILEALRGERKLPTYLRPPVDLIPFIEEAEVVVVYGNPSRSETAEHPWDWNCALGREIVPACGRSTACGPETFAQYEDDLGAIYEEIFAIRGGEPVVLRTSDWYLPWGPLETWRECGHEDVCKRCTSNWASAIHRAADRYGVPAASLLHRFSGPDLETDLPRSFIRDDVHPSDEGAAAIADVLAELGYEPVTPQS